VTTRYEWVELLKYGDLLVHVVSATGDPLKDAEVTVNQQWTGNTDASGDILFEDLPAELAEVLAVYTKGYEEPILATEFTIDVHDGDVSRISIRRLDRRLGRRQVIRKDHLQ
jgi:hypothetical protein